MCDRGRLGDACGCAAPSHPPPSAQSPPPQERPPLPWESRSPHQTRELDPADAQRQKPGPVNLNKKTLSSSRFANLPPTFSVLASWAGRPLRATAVLGTLPPCGSVIVPYTAPVADTSNYQMLLSLSLNDYDDQISFSTAFMRWHARHQVTNRFLARLTRSFLCLHRRPWGQRPHALGHAGKS